MCDGVRTMLRPRVGLCSALGVSLGDTSSDDCSKEILLCREFAEGDPGTELVPEGLLEPVRTAEVPKIVAGSEGITTDGSCWGKETACADASVLDPWIPSAWGLSQEGMRVVCAAGVPAYLLTSEGRDGPMLRI